jgi:hypothetical protein
MMTWGSTNLIEFSPFWHKGFCNRFVKVEQLVTNRKPARLTHDKIVASDFGKSNEPKYRQMRTGWV